MITISNDEARSHGGISPRLHGKSNVFTCGSVQTLILVEDVDMLFLEDRGCIAAIQHISETAKGPIILTNRKVQVYGSLPFDLEACPHIIPKIPWSYPSDVQELQSICGGGGFTDVGSTMRRGAKRKTKQDQEVKHDAPEDNMTKAQPQAKQAKTSKPQSKSEYFKDKHNLLVGSASHPEQLFAITTL
ncbi:hypothetical protein JHK82_035626 [Glycine max]|nr:hypothetical protein JHK85_036352 [Glycine max]KAG4976285.1 hypothetical protein JHK86_035759 [Glycine max]KAG5112357.1 hypothetical protein JHK82_035626 [Glycine max]